MIEEAARLETYLPMSYRTPKERDYVRFLWEAFDINVNLRHDVVAVGRLVARVCQAVGVLEASANGIEGRQAGKDALSSSVVGLIVAGQENFQLLIVQTPSIRCDDSSLAKAVVQSAHGRLRMRSFGDNSFYGTRPCSLLAPPSYSAAH